MESAGFGLAEKPAPSFFELERSKDAKDADAAAAHAAAQGRRVIAVPGQVAFLPFLLALLCVCRRRPAGAAA